MEGDLTYGGLCSQARLWRDLAVLFTTILPALVQNLPQGRPSIDAKEITSVINKC